ncbi:MFS transporter [Streptomyces sp. DT190]|uniref:MFS transporter n=1 Tax=Streptomyces sp. DT190 TaxID=3416527 RepID=UPI003CF19A5C
MGEDVPDRPGAVHHGVRGRRVRRGGDDAGRGARHDGRRRGSDHAATLAIIGNVFPRGAERTKAMGTWSAAVGVGTVIGPMVGGWPLGTFWWGSVFLINLPIGIAV